MLIASNFLLWIIVVLMAVAILALLRRIGNLEDRISTGTAAEAVDRDSKVIPLVAQR